MKFGISMLSVDLGNDFIERFDAWKEKVMVEGMKYRLRELIEKDLNTLEEKK